MRGRRLALGGLLVVALLALAPPAAAHPLGNATVSRAVAVLIGSTQAQITYVVDMAEIPAYAATLEIDADGDGSASASERHAWSTAICGAAAEAVEVTVDDHLTAVARSGDPELTFPPGVGGLETLRLVCPLTAVLPATTGPHRIAVFDHVEDGRRGWREVTIASVDGITLVASDVPSVSPSGLLTAYPEDLLAAPAETRAGAATYGATTGAAGAGAAPGPATSGGSDAARDPLADLLAGPRTPLAWLVAVALAMGLGVAHALSPGHGKALIAAYVIGSRSAVGQAVGLGLSAAASHTIGVLVLGAIVLSASELLVPERVVAWLSVGSGILVVIVGGLVAARALHRRSAAGRGDHGHVHAEGHAHGHERGHEEHRHQHEGHQHEGHRSPLHEVVALGLVGGAIPSTSALLVLLVAVATGRLVEGMLLIVAFGGGMAIVLGGLAAVTGLAGSRLAGATQRSGVPVARRLAGAAPLVSAVVIMAVGAVTTIGALGSL